MANAYKHLFSFNTEWNYRSITLLGVLVLLPNILGMINIQMPMGFNIHFFQIAIFLAAFIYGPIGGLFSGAIGSVYSAFLMGNPYLVIGNVLLGFSAGLFARYLMNNGFDKMMHSLTAVMLAFAIQLLWLIPTDFYLMHMPAMVMLALVFALLVSNIAWAVAAYYIAKPLKEGLQNA
jgi:uncharacterized membrane protein